MEHQSLDLTFRPLNFETWLDFEALFEKHRGVRGGCWCVYYLCKSTDYNRMGAEGRRAFHRELALSGRAQGLIAYEGETPVGWCQFGTPDVLCQYSRGRAYSKLDILPEDRPDWRISCLFTDKHRRSKGIAIQTLHAALEEIARRGGGVVEAFPLDSPKIKHNVFSGSADMYRREGFAEVVRLTENTLLMRRRVEPMA
ncbi:MAG: hypothetical protein ABFD03_05645 [Clostridiaceae bacterium]